MQFKKWMRATIIFLLLLVATGSALAQEGVTQWQRYDVRLVLQQNSGLNVEEIHEVVLAGGVTQFTKIIPTDKVEAVQNVQVLQFNPGGGQRNFTQADTGAEYTFELMPSGSGLAVKLHFPPNAAPSTTFVIRYFAVGAVRFYAPGDRLEWRPFGAAAPGPIGSATIEMRLPAGFTKDQLKPASNGISAEKYVPEDNRVEFKATNVAAGDNLEVSLTFPHGVIQGVAPAWQLADDSLTTWSPILRWGSLLVAILLLFGGPGAAYGWWYWRLRIAPPQKKIPNHLKTPPSKLSPALAGVLLDGKFSARHITATLLDLAARESLHVYPDSQQSAENVIIDEEASKEDGVEFVLYGVDQSKAVRPYEETVYTKIFGFQGGRKRNLADVRNMLFMAVPEIKNQIETEVLKAGFFPENPKRLKQQYLAFGGAGILMGIVLSLLVLAIFSRYSLLVVCPFASIVLGAVAFIVAGFAAPKRTVTGQQHAVRWEAFRRYLKEMNTDDIKEARSSFARLLPYAVALGVDKDFVEKFATNGAPAPHWWSIPPEKRPDTSHENAHDWVSAAAVSRPQPEQRSKSVIRRLGTDGSTPEAAIAGGPLLKKIQPAFSDFLILAFETFSKAPVVDDEDKAPDFEIIGGKN